MATGKKTGGKNFAKGNPGRPVGSVVVPKAVKDMNRQEVEKLITKYMKMSRPKLAKVAKKLNTPTIDLMIIKIITTAINKGDYTRFSFLLDRTIGKVKESVDVTNSDGSMRGTVTVTLPSNGREKKDDA